MTWSLSGNSLLLVVVTYAVKFARHRSVFFAFAAQASEEMCEAAVKSIISFFCSFIRVKQSICNISKGDNEQYWY